MSYTPSLSPPKKDITTLNDEIKFPIDTSRTTTEILAAKKKKSCKKCIELKQKIKELEMEVAKLIERSEVKINFRSILDLSDERISELVEKYYNESLYMEGRKGMVTFIYSYIVRDEDQNIVYKCIDPERNIFEYMDESGTVRKDRKANQLFAAVYQHIVKKANKIYRTLLDKLYEQDEKNPYTSDDEEDEVLEVIEEELSIDEDIKIQTIDDQINNVVRLNIEIKKISKNKKLMVDELTRMLYI